MCGIFAYIGIRNAPPILIDGLKRLEYRGYDSSDISIKNNNLHTIKVEGGVNKLNKKLSDNNITGSIGIAHTKWATHGQPNERNAHHPICCNEEISMHNSMRKWVLKKKQS